MTNRKTTRRALVLSLLSLLLCCSMLVGTTFAWFTDSVTSGNNKIVAGNLDIELYNDVTVNDAAKVGKETPLFEEVTLWEPGVVAYENLTVANVGTLALKYELAVNFDNENLVTDKKVGLSNILQVAFVPGGVSGDRDAVLQQAKSYFGPMAGFVEQDELHPVGTADKASQLTYGIVIWWEPSANDNDWNVNNGRTTSDGEPLHIDLGISLLATQFTYESDSFDNTYDVDAWTDVAEPIQPDADGVVYVYTPAQLASIGTTDGVKVVEIMEDIDLEGKLWTPVKVNNSGDDTFTVNGNGHTIFNMTIEEREKSSTNTTYGTGFIGNAYAGDVTVRDLTFANANVSGKGDYVGAVVGYAYYADVLLENVDVVDSYITSTQWNAKSIGGLIGNKHMIDGAGAATADGFQVIDCSVSDTTVLGYSQVGGLVGALPYCDKMNDDTFQNCAITDSRVIAYYNMPMDLLAVNTVLPVSDDDFTVTNSIVAPRIGSSNAATSAAQLSDSVSKYDVVYLGKDYTFELKGNQRDGLTLIGLGNTKLSNLTNFAGNGNLGAIWQNVNFENVIFTEKVYTMTDGAKSTFKDCVFQQGFRGGYSRGVEFDGCTFYDNDEGFAMHFQKVYTTVTCTDCTFAEGTVAFGDDGAGLVTFDNCVFSGETIRTEYFDAWASCVLNDCTFNKPTEIWHEHWETGETVTLNNTTGATVVQK